jgi:cytochrome b subunit of formate dehydrogenase
MVCHSRIEEVHVQIIKGELWESQPGAIPACTDCHLPHRVRKEALALTLSDRSCLRCHQNPEVHKVVDGNKISLVISKEELTDSQHRNIPCVKCHNDVNPKLSRPCSTAKEVECANCHAKVSEEYFSSGHGQAYMKKEENAPYCVDCHGGHTVKSHLDENSLTFRSSIPTLCGECHKKGGKAPTSTELTQVDAITDYSRSVHGRGLSEKGLLPSAICIDCHNSHLILHYDNPRSSVSRENIPATCSTCHRGIFKDYIKSIHFTPNENEKEKYPTCSDCHSSHTISNVEQDKFLLEVTHQCGSCHKDLSDTYFDTMHGKAYTLGYMKAAKCSDCHGSHDILGVNDPASHVGYRNVVNTCQKCHEDANRQFTGYLTHATHHDPVKYPILFYTYWAMTSLLIGVFGFFGIHTLLWLPRSIKHMRKRKEHLAALETKYYISRFSTSQRVTHIFVIVSFILLALTGMMLKFSTMAWAQVLSKLLGGVSGAGFIHRAAAVITFGYFFYHLFSIYKEKRRQKLSWLKFIFHKNSLMFNLQDVKDFFATVKWFLGFGPRPPYGRWTYWEKFDYFAVFWGVAIIGISGLIQWFPEYSTIILPGWLINVASIIHSDEALLAVGFIFTIHFFNTHLRPGAFPMDKVIFTGVVPLDEFREERPREYEELKKSGALRKRMLTPEITERRERTIAIFGYTALIIGVGLIGLIIYSMMYGYK